MTALPDGFVLDNNTTNGGTIGGALPEAFVIDPTIEPIKKKEEPTPAVVKWAENRMRKEGRTEPSLWEKTLIGISAGGEGSKDALQSVGEGMAQGASLGGYGAAMDYATGSLGRGDLSYSARKQNREDKYGGWETGVHTLSEIAGAIPTGKAIYKGVNAGLGALPKGASLADGLTARALSGSIEGGIHGGFNNGKQGALYGAGIGAALPIALTGIGKGIKYAGKGAKHLLGLTTGTSSDSVGQAYSAGKRGSKEFLNNIRGKESMENVLDDVQEGVRHFKNEGLKEYKRLRPEVLGDKTRLDPKPIKQAFKEVKDSLLEGGQQYKSGGTTEKTLKEVGQAVDEFMMDQPNHNALGFDSFKKRIGDILQDIDYKNENARRIAGDVYHTAKNEIGKQAPKYYEMVGKYGDVMHDVSDLQKAFSLKSATGTNVDTALRKVQSVMRSGVNTNYGKRLELLNKLYNAEQIKDKVAGQFMRDVLPRGLARGSAATLGGIGLYLHNPATIPLALASSPRLVGEAAYKAGQLATKTQPISKLIMEAQKTGVLPYLATMNKGEE